MKKKSVKNENKKKWCKKICWATAQLCHNKVGNCIVTQPVLGVQWVQSVLQECVVAGKIVLQWVAGWLRFVSQYTAVYCDRGAWLLKELYCNTR